MKRCLVALLLTLAISRGLDAQCPNGSPPPCARRSEAARANAVAVLPFDERSRDSTVSYIADGIGDEITALLAAIDRLQVVSHTTARRIASTQPAVRAIGQSLGAPYLVTGSVQLAAGRLRVSAELLRASTGVQLWSARYDRARNELLAVQSEIARNVAARIVGPLNPDELSRLAAPPTDNAAAYDLYLRAGPAFFTVDDVRMQHAISSLEAAVSLDSRFAAAWGRLALLYSWAVDRELRISGTPLDTVYARAVAAADRALLLDSSSAEAWAGKGSSLFFARPPDYAGAAAALGRAAALDTVNTSIQLTLGVLLRRLGDYEGSEAVVRRALRHEVSAQHFQSLAYVEESLRRPQQALVLLDSAILLNPKGWVAYGLRARVKVRLGDVKGARKDATEAVRLSGLQQRYLPLSILAHVNVAAGDSSTARAQLDTILAAAARDTPTPRQYYVVIALLATGRRGDALDLLERIQPRGAWLWSYLVSPDFDSLRSDPRFTRVLEESRPPMAPRQP